MVQTDYRDLYSPNLFSTLHQPSVGLSCLLELNFVFIFIIEVLLEVSKTV